MLHCQTNGRFVRVHKTNVFVSIVVSHRLFALLSGFCSEEGHEQTRCFDHTGKGSDTTIEYVVLEVLVGEVELQTHGGEHLRQNHVKKREKEQAKKKKDDRPLWFFGVTVPDSLSRSVYTQIQS